MRVDFEKLNVPMIELYAASVTHLDSEYRINVAKNHSNLPNQAFVYEIAEGDGSGDIVAKGFGVELEATMHKAVNKVREMAQATRDAQLPVETADGTLIDPVVGVVEEPLEGWEQDLRDAFVASQEDGTIPVTAE